MDTNDTLGLGKVLPIDKLIDILSKAVGRVTKSYFDRKDVDTKTYEILKIAEANAKVKQMEIIAKVVNENSQITGGIDCKDEGIAISSPRVALNEIPQTFPINPSLAERTQERITFQEAKKQLNVENITAFATEELKNQPPVTDEPLDEDWTTRFFKIAEEVSNEEIQALWGKILAGEIKHPKTYSLRTLELLRNLSQTEASIFMKVANFAIADEQEHFLFKVNEEDLLIKNYNIRYEHIALLIEIGLIQSGGSVYLNLYTHPTDREMTLISGKVIIIVKIKAFIPTIRMPVYVFTNSGNELLTLINSEPQLDYLAAVAHSIESEDVDVKYGYILGREGDDIRHTEPLQKFI